MTIRNITSQILRFCRHCGQSHLLLLRREYKYDSNQIGLKNAHSRNFLL